MTSSKKSIEVLISREKPGKNILAAGRDVLVCREDTSATFIEQDSTSGALIVGVLLFIQFLM